MSDQELTPSDAADFRGGLNFRANEIIWSDSVFAAMFPAIGMSYVSIWIQGNIIVSYKCLHY